MTIPQNVLDDIQDKTDIVGLISSYIPLKKSGRNFRALCPFHSEKTASFFVSPQRQIYHCFGCGMGGGPIQFVMQYEKINFPEAVELLARRLGISIPRRPTPLDSLKSQCFSVNKEAGAYFHKNLFSSIGQKALDYLVKRGIKQESIKNFKIGYATPGFRNLIGYLRSKSISLSVLEKAGLISRTRDGSFIDLFRDRIIFPIFDVKSRVIGFGARRLIEADDIPKYINTPETILYHKAGTLYGIHLAKDSILKEDSCIVTEGYLDMIVPYQAGITNIIASSGTALTEEQIRTIKRYTKNVVLIFDSDAAGRISSLRAADLMIEADLNVKAVSLPSGFDPDSFLRAKGKDSFVKLIQGAEDFFFYKLNILREKFDINVVKEKSELFLEMLSTLKKFNNQLTRYEYLKQLAEKLDTKEEFLIMELKQLDKGRRTAARFQTSLSKKTNPAEEYVVKCMLFDKGIFGIIREALAVEEFSDPLLQELIKESFQYWDTHNDFDVNKMLAQVSEELANKITQLTFEDFTPQEQALKESILRVKQNFQKLKKQLLKDKIRAAEEAEDNVNLTKLISEFQSLIEQEQS